MKKLITLTLAATMLSGCLGTLIGLPGDFEHKDTVTLECPGVANKRVHYFADSQGNDFFVNDQREYVELPDNCYAIYPNWKQEFNFKNLPQDAVYKTESKVR